jgi:hypothetical protein
MDHRITASSVSASSFSPISSTPTLEVKVLSVAFEQACSNYKIIAKVVLKNTDIWLEEEIRLNLSEKSGHFIPKKESFLSAGGGDGGKVLQLC